MSAHALTSSISYHPPHHAPRPRPTLAPVHIGNRVPPQTPGLHLQRGRGPPDPQRMDPKAAGRRRLVPRGGGARERGGHVRFCISTPRNSEAAIPPSGTPNLWPHCAHAFSLCPAPPPASRPTPAQFVHRATPSSLLILSSALAVPPLCIGVHSIPSVSISRTFLCSALLLRTAPHRIAPHRSALLFPTVSLTFLCSLRSASHRS